ncbi:hypothetical protein VP01_1167g5 [Puccinia sorghi]|uniref:Uncharacterized protein n=1 Tax=Puccinia sorghi TaxID=27349 RepID=A0A0L6VST9_9BASI|nr:hypothetical protein VP01_1167g5 [Puccinia sorghi]
MLRPIDTFWKFKIKWKYLQSPIQTFSCRLFLNALKVDFQHSDYNIGLTGTKAQRDMKRYSSHFRIPRAALMDVHIMSR